jgi:hypothetical protein
MKKAGDDTDDFNTKVGNFAKAAGAAFLALGAAAAVAAVKIGIDGVKAAIEDEKAQASLAQTLKNVTKATDVQIKATEEYIDKTARATGIADDQLRPSLDRLVRSTGDVTKAQKLQTLALDIAAGTGKDLSAVSEALAKTYDGNFGALKRLGVPLDESIIKSKDFDAAVKALSVTFAGQADVAANTFSGRMARIKVAVDEAKESIGFALLPFVEKLATFITTNVLPTLESFIQGLTGQKGVKKAVYDAGTGIVSFTDDLTGNQAAGYGLGVSFRELGKSIAELNSALFASSGEGSGLVQMINGLTKLTNLISDLLAPFTYLIDLGNRFAESQSQKRYDLPLPSFLTAVPFPAKGQSSSGTTVNVNVSGAVDKVSTARTVVTAINSAAKQGTVNKLAANTSLR